MSESKKIHEFLATGFPSMVVIDSFSLLVVPSYRSINKSSCIGKTKKSQNVTLNGPIWYLAIGPGIFGVGDFVVVLKVWIKQKLKLLVWKFQSRTYTAISHVRIPTTVRQSGSEVRLVVSTSITLIQYVYINRSSTDARSTGWRQVSFILEVTFWERVQDQI